MGNICGSRGSCLQAALMGTKGQVEKLYGSISILAEEISGGNDDVKFQVGGSALMTKDWMGKGDHYLKVMRRRKDGVLDPIKSLAYKTSDLVTEVRLQHACRIPARHDAPHVHFRSPALPRS
jgi:hypothetical protein